MWQNTMTYDVGTVQCEDGTTRCETKNKGITECDKNTITCDVNIAQYEDNTIKCGKKKKLKIKELPNVTKVQSYVMYYTI